MKNNKLIYFMLLMLTLAFVNINANSDSNKEFCGKYYSLDSNSIIIIEKRNDSIFIKATGGSDDSYGDAVSANCEINAKGIIHQDTLIALFCSFENEQMKYSARRAEIEKREIKIIISTDTIDVIEADVDGYCGLNASFEGLYKKQ